VQYPRARHGRAARADLEAFHEIVRTIAFAGTEPVLESVLPIARSFLDAEQALAYRLECHDGGLDLDFVHCVGGGPMDRLLREVQPYLSEVREPLFAYRLPTPLPAERNTIFNSAAEAVRERYLASAFVRELFPRLGFPGRETLRVLLCDGPHLLSWFGVFRGDRFGEREAERLESLIAPLVKRLALEDRLRRLSVRSAALDVAMDALATPAFILDRRGGVVHANEAGRALPPEERERLVERARSKDLPAEGELALLPIRAKGVPPHAFLVQRAGTTLRQRLALFARQWKLTRRQTQVLQEILEGRPNKAIAAALGIQEKTVELHVTALFRKVGVESRAELLAAFWTPRR
jgi:DNA-binding CsgD family transcriptional regulator